MNKKLSIVLVFSVLFGMFFSINTGFALNPNQELSTSAVFVTDDLIESTSISNLPTKLNDKMFLTENKVKKFGLEGLNTKIKIKGLKNSTQITESTTEDAEAIFIENQLINNKRILEYAKHQVEAGKPVYFYGDNIDLNNFAKIFNLERNLKTSNPNLAKTPAPNEQKFSELGDNAKIFDEKHKLIYVGVEKGELGPILITGEDSEYNFYRTVDFLLKDAIHSKETRVKKPYKDLNTPKNSTSTQAAGLFRMPAYAVVGDIDNYPIINSQRKSTAFRSNAWYLITDLYLHRVPDNDTTYDYFILEAISELNIAYSGSALADIFWTNIQPRYTEDKVRDGGPATQGGTTEVNVQLTSPYVSFTYAPGSDVSVESQLYLSENRFYTSYIEAYFLRNTFNYQTIFRTQLSFACYAPNSGYTYTDTYIWQAARENPAYQWHYAFNPTNYYYDY